MLPAVKVSVLEATAGLGLNDAVTPLGRPEAEKLTLLVKPLCGATLMVVAAFDPWVTPKLLGEAESVKFPTTVTVSVMGAELVRLPEVPVSVSVAGPVGAVLLAVRVRTLEVAAGFGLNEAVTPLGSPETDRVTLPLKPFN